MKQFLNIFAFVLAVALALFLWILVSLWLVLNFGLWGAVGAIVLVCFVITLFIWFAVREDPDDLS